jgi:predicted AlkP superfamily phosphohydrolase/phosphomutase
MEHKAESCHRLGKVILLGIDGATPSMMFPWAEQGKLPNLRRVLRQGAYGTLESTLPPYSAQAWVSMMTGRQPPKHGVLDFFERDAGQAQHSFISSALIRGEALWSMLNRQGKRVGVVNVPLTYPPVQVNGYMVSGFMTPKGRDDYVYPPELRTEILNLTGQYDPDPWDLMAPEQDLPSFQRWMDITEQVALHLHQKYPVDVYVNVIQALDQIQHSFWHLISDEQERRSPQGQRVWPNIKACYLAVDEAIGRRLDWLDDDTTLFLASDHGFQSVSRWFYVNRWLAGENLLHLAQNQASQGKSLLATMGLSRESVRDLVRRLDPLGVRRLLGRFARASIADKLDDSLALPIDWPTTAAYSGSRTSEGIYINLRGREPQGIVEPGRPYEDLRSQIIERLTALLDPATNKPVVSGVFRREDVYSEGEFLPQMPDLLLAFDDRPYLVNESTAGGPVFAPIRGGDVRGRHHSLGLFAAVGANVIPGTTIQARIVDVAPTMLYAAGLPVPAGLDGRVLQEIFTPQFRGTHAVHYEDVEHSHPQNDDPAPSYSAEEEAEMQRRLRALGYLD